MSQERDKLLQQICALQKENMKLKNKVASLENASSEEKEALLQQICSLQMENITMKDKVASLEGAKSQLSSTV